MQAYETAANNISNTKGQIYNIGGGPKITLSVWIEYKPVLEKLFNKKIHVNFSNWCRGDQTIFIADIRKAKAHFGWESKTKVYEGIEKLYMWIKENNSLFKQII